MKQLPDSQAPSEDRMRNPCKTLNYFLSAKGKCQVLPVPWEGGLQKEAEGFWAEGFCQPREEPAELQVLWGGFVRVDTDLQQRRGVEGNISALIMRKPEDICRGDIGHMLLNTHSAITSQIARPGGDKGR